MYYSFIILSPGRKKRKKKHQCESGFYKNTLFLSSSGVAKALHFQNPCKHINIALTKQTGELAEGPCYL